MLLRGHSLQGVNELTIRRRTGGAVAMACDCCAGLIALESRKSKIETRKSIIENQREDERRRARGGSD